MEAHLKPNDVPIIPVQNFHKTRKLKKKGSLTSFMSTFSSSEKSSIYKMNQFCWTHLYVSNGEWCNLRKRGARLPLCQPFQVPRSQVSTRCTTFSLTCEMPIWMIESPNIECSKKCVKVQYLGKHVLQYWNGWHITMHTHISEHTLNPRSLFR